MKRKLISQESLFPKKIAEVVKLALIALLDLTLFLRY